MGTLKDKWLELIITIVIYDIVVHNALMLPLTSVAYI